MGKKLFVTLSTALILIFGRTIQAQQIKRIPKIGVLTPSDQQWEEAAFRVGLRQIGYIEGSSIIVDVRSAEGQLDRLPSLASELVKSHVDAILAVNTPGTRAAIAATTTVPIVMTAIGDPIGLGFVKSFARPGGNVTGLSNMAGDLAGKRLQLLNETVPSAKRIAVMMHPDEPIVPIQLHDLQSTAPSLGLQLEVIPVRNPGELQRAFRTAIEWRAQAILRLAGQAGTVGRPTAEFALKHRLPSMLLVKQDVEAGALMSYFSDHKILFRRAASYIDKILKGAKPGDMPVEQPTHFEFYVNLKTAKQIGVTIPPNVLARADKVIK